MPTNKLKAYSTTPGSNNSAAPDGFPEGMLPSDVNNSAREMMARMAEWYQDAQWVRFNHTIGSSTSSAVVISGADVTSIYTAGRAIRLDQDNAKTGWVSSSSYSAPDTTVNIVGLTVSSPTIIEASVLTAAAIPRNAALTLGTTTVGELNATSVSTASGVVSGTLTVGTLTPTVFNAPVGYVVGRAYKEVSTASGALTGSIPADTSIPQSGEGDEIIGALAYAPASNTNRLRFRATINARLPSAKVVFALFSSASSNAIGSTLMDIATGGWGGPIDLQFETVPGTITSANYTVRAGTSSGTYYINQDASGNTLGGSMKSSLVIEEIKAS